MFDVNVLTNNGININNCLELFGNVDLYNLTLKDYLSSINEKIQNMELFLNEGHILEYGNYAQTIKSESRYLGFTDLSDIAAELESKANQNDINFIKANHAQLINEVNKMISISKQYFGVARPQDVALTKQENQKQSAATPQGYGPIIRISGVQAVCEVPPVMPTSIVPQQSLSGDTIRINMSGDGVRPFIRPKMMKDRILIVDDSQMILRFVQRVLSEDYEIITASDGAEAIKLLDDPKFRHSIKSCLLDLNMPNVDGYAVLEHCKQNNYFSELPIAVESGIEDTSSLDKVNSYSIVGILIKPYKENDLRRIVDKGLTTYF